MGRTFTQNVQGIADEFYYGNKDRQTKYDSERQLLYEMMSQASQASINEETAEANQKRAMGLWDYTNYPNQVKAAKAAGLSTSLLYQQGGQGGSASGAGQNRGTGAGQSQAVMMGLQAKQVAAQTRLANAEANKADAEAAKTSGADTSNTMQNTELQKSQQELNEAVQELTNNQSVTEQERSKLVRTQEELTEKLRDLQQTISENLDSQTAVNYKTVERIDKDIEHIEESIHNLMEQTAGMNLDNQLKAATMEANVQLAYENVKYTIAKTFEATMNGQLSDKMKDQIDGQLKEWSNQQRFRKLNYYQQKREIQAKVQIWCGELEQQGIKISQDQRIAITNTVINGVNALARVADAASGFMGKGATTIKGFR